jgi:hypothetical protein
LTITSRVWGTLRITVRVTGWTSVIVRQVVYVPQPQSQGTGQQCRRSGYA